MNETKHTPGPWHYKMDGFQITIGDKSTRHDYLEHDYIVVRIEDNSIQAEANARLIAAAPDLLEACKEALKNLMHMTEPVGNQDKGRRLAAISTLGQVITKAEGGA